MAVGWLLDEIAFDDYYEELEYAIRCNGDECVAVRRPLPPYRWEDIDNSYRSAFPANSCVVAHGDIDLIQRIASDKIWTPGYFGVANRYYCSSYYRTFAPYLLNCDYQLITYGDLPQLLERIISWFAVDQRIFVRPDSPLKLFSGQTISIAHFERDYEFIGFNDLPDETRILVSSPKTIIAEWRFVVADGIIVSGSQYHDGTQFISSPTIRTDASEYAQHVVDSTIAPEPVWILDICQSAHQKYHVLEVGGFSCSSLYAADKAAVVRAVSAAAIRLHKHRS